MSISQKIALGVLAVSLGWLFWLHYIRPFLMPIEGLEKLLLVVAGWWLGGWLVYGAIAHQLYYWQPALLVGLGLLLWASWTAYGPFRRWQEDRMVYGGFWGTGGTDAAAPQTVAAPHQETDKAA